MASYRVVGKHILRAETYDVQMGTRPDGSPNLVRQQGVMRKIEIGTILDDVQPEELAAFPDRFALVDEQDKAAMQRSAQASPEAETVLMTPGRGNHEPAAGPEALVQKPPLSGEEQAMMKAAQREAERAQGEADKAHAEIEQKKAEAQGQAMARMRREQATTEPAAPAAPATSRQRRESQDT